MTPLVFVGEFGGSVPVTQFNNIWNYLREVDTDVYGLVTLNARTGTVPQLNPLSNNHTRDSTSLRSRLVAQFIRNQNNASFGTGKDQIQPPINQMTSDSAIATRLSQRTSAYGEKAIGADTDAGIVHFYDFVDWNNGRTADWPTYYKFPDVGDDGKVKNVSKQTLSSGFHEGFFITDDGKLRSAVTKNYSSPNVGGAGVCTMFQYFMFQEYYENYADLVDAEKTGVGGETGPDRRIGEMFINEDLVTAGSSLEQFYDAGITLESVSCASDNCVATLNSKGTIRVIGGRQMGAFPTDNVRETVYFDKDDVANGFFADESGTPQEITNEGFVKVCVAGGGTNVYTPVTIWGVHESGKLYGADWPSSITFDVPLNRWKRIEPWLDVNKTQINPEWMKKPGRESIQNVISCPSGTDGVNRRNFDVFCWTKNGKMFYIN